LAEELRTIQKEYASWSSDFPCTKLTTKNIRTAVHTLSILRMERGMRTSYRQREKRGALETP
jgi:hypothetical protein